MSRIYPVPLEGRRFAVPAEGRAFNVSAENRTFAVPRVAAPDPVFVVWLLSGGEWNDDGNWVDTESWEDS